jgi:quinolinate synthase
MSTVDLPLLPLGLGTDRSSERGVECPGDLPSSSDPDLVAPRRAKEMLGERCSSWGTTTSATR